MSTKILEINSLFIKIYSEEDLHFRIEQLLTKYKTD